MSIDLPKTAKLFLVVFTLFSHQQINAQNRQPIHAKVDSLNRLFNNVFSTDLAKAETLAKEALHLSVRSGYAFGEATARSNQSAFLLKTEGHTKAIEAGFAALKIFDKEEKYKNSFEYGNTFIRLAKSFHMEKDSIRSKAYTYQALRVGERIRDQHLMALAYEHLGNIHSYSPKVDSALYYYGKAKKEFSRTNYFTGLANIANNTGAMYSDRMEHQEAINYFREALSIYQQNNLKSSLTTGHYNIGLTYHQLKLYKNALPPADSAVYYAQLFKRNNSLLKAYLLKAQIYQGLGNADSSASYYEKTIALKDSTYNDNYKKELAALQTQSDVYKKETENQLLSKDKRIAVLYRNLAIAGIGGLIIVLGFLLISQRLRIQRRVKNQLEEEVVLRTKEIFRQKETIYQANLQLKLALNSATFDSHFAINILQTIQEGLHQRTLLETQAHLAMLSHLVQYVLEKSPLERVPLSEELQIVELYIQLEQLRLQHRFTYDLNIQSDVMATIPATLLQPFVEHAILHGIAPATGHDLFLHIEAATHEGVLTVVITDNGADRRKEKLNKYNPRCSQIGQERLDLLTHLTHKNHLVIIDDLTTATGASAGTKMTIKIPMDARVVVPALEPLETSISS